MSQENKNITQLLMKAQAGNRQSLDDFLPLVYDELRRIAAYKLSLERSDHTLQATALVHEAYLRLIDQAFCQLLVNYAENRNAKKRGNGKTLISLDDAGDVGTAKAERNYQQMIKLFDELAASDAKNFDYRQKRWQAAYSYADELLRYGKIKEARNIYEEEFTTVEKTAREKDSKFAGSMRGFMLEKTADCDTALAKQTNLPPAKQREIYESSLDNYENSLKLWSNGGAQISPGVSDAERPEIVRQKAEICRTELSKL